MYEDNEKLLKEYKEGKKTLANVIVENNLGLINYVLKGFRWAFKNYFKFKKQENSEDNS